MFAVPAIIAAVTGFGSWITTRSKQIATGSLGIVAAVVVGIVLIVGGLVWLKSSIEAGAIAGRDVTWLTKLATANNRAVEQERLRREAIARATDLERQKKQAEQNVAAVSQRVRELEEQLASYSGNENPDGPIVFPKAIARSLRK